MREENVSLRLLLAGGILGALMLAIGPISTPLMAVEGAGAYRGSGVILPYFSNTSSVITFYRFTNSFALDESPWNGDGGGAPDIDQRQIWIHITYLTPNDEADPATCDELNSFFPMTRQDYYLLNVRSDRNSPAPFTEGYAVAWAVADDSGFPDQKIYHNHISADQVTVDIANGWAWGVNASAFRAFNNENCFEETGETGGGCSNPDDWYAVNGDGEEYAVLGQNDNLPGDPYQYENLRFPENFFPTVMASNANISGARTLDGGTRYYVVPLSWIIEPNGIPGPQSEEVTVLVPETLPGSSPYTNQYGFDVRLFDSDENRLSLPNQEVVCWACLSAVDLVGGAGNQFLNGTSGLERSQGWLEFNGRGVQALPTNDGLNTYDYYNRAMVVQVDTLRLGSDMVSWGFYPAHDRTTAEIFPNPNSFDATGAESGNPTDPNSTPVFGP